MFNPNEREKRILDKIKGIKKPAIRRVAKPKKGLSKTAKQVLEIIESNDTAISRLERLTKILK